MPEAHFRRPKDSPPRSAYDSWFAIHGMEKPAEPLSRYYYSWIVVGIACFALGSLFGMFVTLYLVSLR